VKPAPFDYVRPESLEEALAALSNEDAKVLAGGQSLVPALNMRLVRPSILVDVNRIPDLDGIERQDGSVRIGALARQRALEESALVRETLPLVAEAMPHVGHAVTRARGTVGGSVAHADPAAELPVCLVALGGTVATATGREISADDFFVTYFTTSLEPGDLLVETRWPVLGRGWGFAFEELSQRRGDYGLAIVACALHVEDGRVAEARLALGSVVDRPTLFAPELAGHALSDTLAEEVARAIASELELYDNVHASREYQRHLTVVLGVRALRRAWRNAVEGAE
jgi:2-furoyl-CoA dehydrogenase FAD binding subunit